MSLYVDAPEGFVERKNRPIALAKKDPGQTYTNDQFFTTNSRIKFYNSGVILCL